MLKRSVVVFCISLFIFLGWLSFQRQQSKTSPQSLTLTIGDIDFNPPTRARSHIVITSPNGKSVRVLYEDLPLVLSAAQWSADSEWLYYSAVNNLFVNEPEFWVRRVQVGQKEPEVLGNGYMAKIAPQTAQLAYFNKDEHLVIEDNQHQIILDEFRILSDFVWTPDGEWIIFVGQHINSAFAETLNQVYRVHQSGTPLEQLTHNDTLKSIPFISPDGAWLAVSEQTTNGDQISLLAYHVIHLISLNGQPDRILAVGDDVDIMAWSMNGNYLAYIANSDINTDDSLVVINALDLTSERFVLKDSVENIGTPQSIAWSPTDDSIYFSSTVYDRAQVYRFDLKTKKQELIYQTATDRNSLLFIMLSWSPPLHDTWHLLRLALIGIWLLISLFALQLRQRLI